MAARRRPKSHNWGGGPPVASPPLYTPLAARVRSTKRTERRAKTGPRTGNRAPGQGPRVGPRSRDVTMISSWGPLASEACRFIVLLRDRGAKHRDCTSTAWAWRCSPQRGPGTEPLAWWGLPGLGGVAPLIFWKRFRLFWYSKTALDQTMKNLDRRLHLMKNNMLHESSIPNTEHFTLI